MNCTTDRQVVKTAKLSNWLTTYTVIEADYVVKDWVKYYNTIRPHSSLGGLPPAPEAVLPEFFERVDTCLSLN